MRKLILIVLPWFCFLSVLPANASLSKIKLTHTSNTFNINNNEEEPESIVVNVIPRHKNGIFNGNDISYKLEVKNNYTSRQEGKIQVDIKTAFGEVVGTSSTNFAINAHRKKSLSWDIPVENPGFYDIIVTINLTDYDDTIRNVFGYKPLLITTPLHKPADFEEFWQKAQDDLNAVSPEYSITPDDIQSTPTHQVYYVEMNSLDNVKIYGWLTVPRPKGKYPVLYGLGGYKAEMKPLFFDDFVHFTLNVRGIGESNSIINPDNKDLLTLNLEDKNKYVYRGIYMDCLRGLQFLLANENMGLDLNRIGFFGGSQGGTLAWILEALSKKAIFCAVDNPTFCDYSTSYAITQNRLQPEAGFIIKFLKIFLRKNPNITKDKMLTTLSYFEAQNFITEVRCPILMGLGLLDLIAPPTCAYTAFNRLSDDVKKKSQIFTFPNLAHEVSPGHNAYKSTWFYEEAINKLAH